MAGTLSDNQRVASRSLTRSPQFRRRRLLQIHRRPSTSKNILLLGINAVICYVLYAAFMEMIVFPIKQLIIQHEDIHSRISQWDKKVARFHKNTIMVADDASTYLQLIQNVTMKSRARTSLFKRVAQQAYNGVIYEQLNARQQAIKEAILIQTSQKRRITVMKHAIAQLRIKSTNQTDPSLFLSTEQETRVMSDLPVLETSTYDGVNVNNEVFSRPNSDVCSRQYVFFFYMFILGLVSVWGWSMMEKSTCEQSVIERITKRIKHMIMTFVVIERVEHSDDVLT